MFKKPINKTFEETYDVPDLDKQKQDILENFDFDIVLNIMHIPCKAIYDDDLDKVIGYEPWSVYCNGYIHIPNAKELRYIAIELIDDVIKYVKDYPNKWYNIATGPFEVFYGNGVISLKFIMESWGTY